MVAVRLKKVVVISRGNSGNKTKENSGDKAEGNGDNQTKKNSGSEAKKNGSNEAKVIIAMKPRALILTNN